MTKEKKKAILWGIVATLSMFIFYLVIMLLSMPLIELWWNFSTSWYLFIPLILGFGLQIGLWSYIKIYSTQHTPGVIPGASGVVSGTAMLACCSHHLFDLLPFLGLASAGLFLDQYQNFFLLLGLAINILAIAYLLYLLDKKQKNPATHSCDKKT